RTEDICPRGNFRCEQPSLIAQQVRVLSPSRPVLSNTRPPPSAMPRCRRKSDCAAGSAAVLRQATKAVGAQERIADNSIFSIGYVHVRANFAPLSGKRNV